MSDTIGAIYLKISPDNSIDLVLGTSSGGPWLKIPGRVGSVKLYFLFNFLPRLRLKEQDLI